MNAHSFGALISGTRTGRDPDHRRGGAVGPVSRSTTRPWRWRFVSSAPLTRASAGFAGVGLVACSILLVFFLDAATSERIGAAPIPIFSIAAGVVLLIVGLVLLATRPWWASGFTALIAAVLWFAPLWTAWREGPAMVRTVGLLAAIFVPVVLGHLVLGFPGGRVDDRVPRLALRSAYAVAVTETLVVALLYDPFRDVQCWANCTDNAFLLLPAPSIAAAAMFSGTALITAMLWFAFARGVAMIGREPGPRWVVVFASAALAVGATIDVIIRGTGDPVTPGSAWPNSARTAQTLGAIALAAGFAWHLAILRRRRLVIDDLVQSSTSVRARTIEQALRTLVDDPTLIVAYWLPASHRYVDAMGRGLPDATPAGGPPTASATLMRAGSPVALIRSGVAASELERELGPAFRIALENEGLRAELRAQLADLRDARSRVVVAGDAHRRQLEHALHDGAQQQLTVLVLRLRSLADAAQASDEAIAPILDDCVVLARAALDELRQVAHGIHPTVLEHEGLSAALRTSATHAAIPVELDEITSLRVSAPIELSAYLFVTGAVEDAGRRGASHAVVRLVVEGSMLVATVKDDGADAATISDPILDRVIAVGGGASISDGNLARAEFPCGS